MRFSRGHHTRARASVEAVQRAPPCAAAGAPRRHVILRT
jgi:hypothetical protein